MKWKTPPIIKIYEALGAVADDRIEMSGSTAKVFSSTRNKFYEVTYDPSTQAIMANDNGSYWKGYLGYPTIAFLMKTGVLEYKESLGRLMNGIQWKDINTKFKNDFDKTLELILKDISPSGRADLAKYAESTLMKIESLNLIHLGSKKTPPEGY